MINASAAPGGPEFSRKQAADLQKQTVELQKQAAEVQKSEEAAEAEEGHLHFSTGVSLKDAICQFVVRGFPVAMELDTLTRCETAADVAFLEDLLKKQLMVTTAGTGAAAERGPSLTPNSILTEEVNLLELFPEFRLYLFVSESDCRHCAGSGGLTKLFRQREIIGNQGLVASDSNLLSHREIQDHGVMSSCPESVPGYVARQMASLAAGLGLDEAPGPGKSQSKRRGSYRRGSTAVNFGGGSEYASDDETRASMTASQFGGSFTGGSFSQGAASAKASSDMPLLLENRLSLHNCTSQHVLLHLNLINFEIPVSEFAKHSLMPLVIGKLDPILSDQWRNCRSEVLFAARHEPADLEAILLRKLAKAPEDFLKEETIIDGIMTAKAKWTKIEQRMKAAHEMYDENERRREKCALRLCLLCAEFAHVDFSKINPLYQFSIEFLVENVLRHTLFIDAKTLVVAKEVMKRHEKKVETHDIVFVERLFSTLLPSILPEDRIAFLLIIYFKYLEVRREIDSNQLRVFLDPLFLRFTPETLESVDGEGDNLRNTTAMFKEDADWLTVSDVEVLRSHYWITEIMWARIKSMERLKGVFHNFRRCVIRDVDQFAQLVSYPGRIRVPDDFPIGIGDRYVSQSNFLEQVILLNTFHPSSTLSYVETRLDADGLKGLLGLCTDLFPQQALDWSIQKTRVMGGAVPIILLHTDGVDPVEHLTTLAVQKNIARGDSQLTGNLRFGGGVGRAKDAKRVFPGTAAVTNPRRAVGFAERRESVDKSVIDQAMTQRKAREDKTKLNKEEDHFFYIDACFDGVGWDAIHRLRAAMSKGGWFVCPLKKSNLDFIEFQLMQFWNARAEIACFDRCFSSSEVESLRSVIDPKGEEEEQRKKAAEAAKRAQEASEAINEEQPFFETAANSSSSKIFSSAENPLGDKKNLDTNDEDQENVGKKSSDASTISSTLSTPINSRPVSKDVPVASSLTLESAGAQQQEQQQQQLLTAAKNNACFAQTMHSEFRLFLLLEHSSSDGPPNLLHLNRFVLFYSTKVAVMPPQGVKQHFGQLVASAQSLGLTQVFPELTNSGVASSSSDINKGTGLTTTPADPFAAASLAAKFGGFPAAVARAPSNNFFSPAGNFYQPTSIAAQTNNLLGGRMGVGHVMTNAAGGKFSIDSVVGISADGIIKTGRRKMLPYKRIKTLEEWSNIVEAMTLAETKNIVRKVGTGNFAPSPGLVGVGGPAARALNTNPTPSPLSTHLIGSLATVSLERREAVFLRKIFVAFLSFHSQILQRTRQYGGVLPQGRGGVTVEEQDLAVMLETIIAIAIRSPSFRTLQYSTQKVGFLVDWCRHLCPDVFYTMFGDHPGFSPLSAGVTVPAADSAPVFGEQAQQAVWDAVRVSQAAESENLVDDAKGGNLNLRHMSKGPALQGGQLMPMGPIAGGQATFNRTLSSMVNAAGNDALRPNRLPGASNSAVSSLSLAGGGEMIGGGTHSQLFGRSAGLSSMKEEYVGRGGKGPGGKNSNNNNNPQAQAVQNLRARAAACFLLRKVLSAAFVERGNISARSLDNNAAMQHLAGILDPCLLKDLVFENFDYNREINWNPTASVQDFVDTLQKSTETGLTMLISEERPLGRVGDHEFFGLTSKTDLLQQMLDDRTVLRKTAKVLRHSIDSVGSHLFDLSLANVMEDGALCRRITKLVIDTTNRLDDTRGLTHFLKTSFATANDEFYRYLRLSGRFENFLAASLVEDAFTDNNFQRGLSGMTSINSTLGVWYTAIPPLLPPAPGVPRIGSPMPILLTSPKRHRLHQVVENRIAFVLDFLKSEGLTKLYFKEILASLTIRRSLKRGEGMDNRTSYGFGDVGSMGMRGGMSSLNMGGGRQSATHSISMSQNGRGSLRLGLDPTASQRGSITMGQFQQQDLLAAFTALQRENEDDSGAAKTDTQVEVEKILKQPMASFLFSEITHFNHTLELIFGSLADVRFYLLGLAPCDPETASLQEALIFDEAPLLWTSYEEAKFAVRATALRAQRTGCNYTYEAELLGTLDGAAGSERHAPDDAFFEASVGAKYGQGGGCGQQRGGSLFFQNKHFGPPSAEVQGATHKASTFARYNNANTQDSIFPGVSKSSSYHAEERRRHQGLQAGQLGLTAFLQYLVDRYRCLTKWAFNFLEGKEFLINIGLLARPQAFLTAMEQHFVRLLNDGLRLPEEPGYGGGTQSSGLRNNNPMSSQNVAKQSRSLGKSAQKMPRKQSRVSFSNASVNWTVEDNCFDENLNAFVATADENVGLHFEVFAVDLLSLNIY